MKRINRKVSELLADYTYYQREYDELIFKTKYSNVTKLEYAQKSFYLAKLNWLDQVLYLEHGIITSHAFLDKKTMQRYYGENTRLEDHYNYELLEEHRLWLKECEHDLNQAYLTEAKEKAAA